MAGEFEECVGLQADYLPTGSISFGRFETESLSWERRSSFSHNRYLEEVEKYSTPGSVTEKKAYFEAHFKKKALLHQASSEISNVAECQTNENNFEDHKNCLEKCASHDGGEHINFSWYSEMPDVLDNYDQEVINLEQDIIGYEQEESPPSDFPVEAASCIDEGIPHTYNELVPHGVAPPTCSVYATKRSDQATSDVGYMPDNASEKVEVLREKEHKSSKNLVSARNAASLSKKLQKTPPKVKATVKREAAKGKLQTRTQNSRSTLTGKSSLSSHIASANSGRNTERESTLRLRVTPPISSGPRDRKSEDSKNLRAKVKQHDKSEKNLKEKKSTPTSQSVVEMNEIMLRQPANRPKRSGNSTKEDVKKSGTFNFKSNERADKRKEYYMRLEEKHHAKEAEMNEIQARVQEEAEAEIKQLRRNLNFKATPMPSFYRETVPRATTAGKKTDAPPPKSSKVQSKCPSSGSRSIASQEKPSACFKESNQEGPYTMNPTSFTQAERPPASEGDTSCLISDYISDKMDEPRDKPDSQTAKKIVADEGGKPGVKQEEGKVKSKEPNNKVRVGVGKSEAMRKVIKGGLSGSLAVHVAS